MVALLSPKNKSAEFYGFFAITGRTSSFIGLAIFGWVAAEAALWHETQGKAILLAEQLGQRVAILSIAIFLILGFILLLIINESKARVDAL